MEITDLITALIALITKSLPSDELRLARFKLRYPKKYANIQKSMLNDFVNECRNKRFTGAEVESYVTLETEDLPTTETQLFIGLVKAELNK